MDVLPLLSIEDFLIANNVSWLDNWAPLSALAVATSLVIHTGFLMVAKAFSIKEFENYALSEILQALATAVMIGFLLVMVNGALELAQTYIAGDVVCNGKALHIGLGSEADSVMDEAYDAIRCRLQEKAAVVASIQMDVTTSTSTFNYFNLMNLQASLLGITFLKGDWFNDLFKETETARITNNLATVILIGLNAQSSVLAYLKANALTTFIPLGLFIRSFYFSRGVGALFIAFGIGMYFIFPIFYVLLDPNFIPAPPVAEEESQADFPQPYCYATMSSTVSVIQTLQAGGLGSTAVLKKENIRDELSKSYVELMLHPLVAFFLTMTFIRYMMTVLGSDSYELVRMASKVV